MSSMSHVSDFFINMIIDKYFHIYAIILQTTEMFIFNNNCHIDYNDKIGTSRHREVVDNIKATKAY